MVNPYYSINPYYMLSQINRNIQGVQPNGIPTPISQPVEVISEKKGSLELVKKLSGKRNGKQEKNMFSPSQPLDSYETKLSNF